MRARCPEGGGSPQPRASAARGWKHPPPRNDVGKGITVSRPVPTTSTAATPEGTTRAHNAEVDRDSAEIDEPTPRSGFTQASGSLVVVSVARGHEYTGPVRDPAPVLPIGLGSGALALCLSVQHDPRHDPIPPLDAHHNKVTTPPTKIQIAMVATMRLCLSVITNPHLSGSIRVNDCESSHRIHAHRTVDWSAVSGGHAWTRDEKKMTNGAKAATTPKQRSIGVHERVMTPPDFALLQRRVNLSFALFNPYF